VPLVAGIDSSTQSTKVQLRDVATGLLIGAGRSLHPATAPPRSEQAPDRWWAALVEAMSGALSEAAERQAGPADVMAVAVAAQQHGLVILDSDDRVVRPAKLWNDTESASDSQGLLDRLSAEGWVEAVGSVPVAAFTVAKLAWLRRCEPGAFKRLARVMLPHDWLTFRLTGRSVTDRGDASGTGYWSPAAGRYRFDLLELIDVDRDWIDAVPLVLGPWEQAGTLTGTAADQLGLMADTPVAVGTGDNMAAALGIGLAPGDVAVSIGTSGTVFATTGNPTHDRTGAVAGLADATGNFLPLVCTLNASLVTRAVGRLLDVDHGQLDALALGAPVGSEGLVLVPYLAGERVPNRPHATGSLYGLRSDVSRECLARSAFEGVVCGLLDGLDALGVAGVPTESGRMVLVGGGARSAGYRQVLATLSRRSVTVPDEDEIVATGAALQAAVSVSDAPADQLTVDWGLGAGALVEPGPDAGSSIEVRARYAEARG
jgi:xylulokinase